MSKRVECPEPGCGATASLGEMRALPSTHGPVVHGTIDCEAGHWFFMPLEQVDAGLVAAQVA
ncbi:MAG: hypothetical protein ABWZ58_06025 [Acidimicrobiia bacterium]